MCDDEISLYDDEISDDTIEQSNVTPEINSMPTIGHGMDE